jgi:CHAT domain-containing protein
VKELDAEFQRLLALAEQAEAEPGLWQTMVPQWEALLERAGHVEDPMFLAELRGNLANTCVRVYEVTGEEQWAERARELYDEVLEVVTHSHYPDTWAITQHALGYLNFLRFEFAGDEKYAQNAEKYYRAALDAIDEESDVDDWAMVQHSLGNLFLSHYERFGDESTAQNCENCCLYALKVYEREIAPLDWALEHQLLGSLYAVRFERSWDDGHARAAEDHFMKALEEFRVEVSPSNWALVQHSLGNVFLGRYERSKNRSDGVAAATHYQNALQVYQRDNDPAHWAGTQYALANLLAHRYEDSGETSHAEASERHYSNALLEYKRESAPTFWASVQHALGNLFSQRYRTKGILEFALSAQHHYGNALLEFREETAPIHWATAQHGLGSLYSLLYEHHREAVYAQKARRSFLSILEYGLSHGLPLIFSYKANASLTRLSFHEGDWTESVRAYKLAQESLQVLLAVQTMRSGKETWLAESYGLSTVAAYAFTQLSQYEDAIVAFETGRTQLIREALEQNRRDLLHLGHIGHQTLLARFENATTELAQMSEVKSDLPIDWMNELQTARSELNEVIQAIQELPDFKDFMKPPSFAQIAEVAADNPLIYLLVTSAGGFALIVAENAIRPIPLPRAREKVVESWLIEEKDGESVGGYLYGQMGYVPISPELDEVLPELGDTITGPLAPALHELGLKDLTLIPSGLLALFPFHAASYTFDGKGCTLLDEYRVSYAPSALLLRRFSEKTPTCNEKFSGILSVGNPSPLPTPYSSLQFARLEAEQVAKVLNAQGQCLYEADATLRAVEERIGSASYLHFACHAEFDHQNPLESGLILSKGERLTLNDLLQRLKLGDRTRLVVLSACKTALTDFSKLPDEALGLPSGFLLAGALGVVGTLWPVDDLSTVLLMIKFYRDYFDSNCMGDQAPISPSESLRMAQLWLRDVTVEELREFVQQLLVEVRADPLTATIKNAFKRLSLEDEDTRPYSHPYYWAGFTYHGI